MGILLLGAAAGTPATAITLTPLLADKVYQRSIASTSGPVALAGTYSGGSLTGVQAQVLRSSDNAVIVDWTTLGSASIAGGSWSGVLSGVPQGAAAATQYYAKVRAANATSVTATGATNWAMGAVFIDYGQSNGGTFFGTRQSPPAASSGTYAYDAMRTPAAWWNATNLDINAGNGVIAFLNGMATLLGCPVAMVNGCIPATSIEFLMSTASGDGFDRFLNGSGSEAGILAGGVTDAEMLLWIQGEGNSFGTSKLSYETSFSQLHSQMATQFGRTKAQFPAMTNGLASLTDASSTDKEWSLMRSIQLAYGTGDLSNVTYSHSMVDATKQDAIHLDGPGNQISAARYLRTATYLYNATGAPAHFEFTGGSNVDATHTDVTVTLTGGATDISPSSGITGFEVSGDNGGSWAAPSAAVRQTATSVRLTHSSMTTTNARKVRYQFGTQPTVSAPLLDNSALTLLANFTPVQDLVPTPLSTVPVATWHNYTSSSWPSVNSGASQEIYTYTVDLDLPIPTADLIVLTLTGQAGASGILPTVTVTPNVGTPVVATNIISPAVSSGAAGTAIWQLQLGAGAVTARRLTITSVHPSNPFGGSALGVWSIAGLSSTTATGSGNNSAGSGTSVSTTLNVSANGVVIAAASSNNSTSGNIGTIAATSATANRQQTVSPFTASQADACLVAASASSSVSATFVDSGAMRISAVAYR